ncbi:murein L,D-transpeptidase catalytic domain family protein [Aquiflexum lacus]|uniref:murein L,D-transpeptidase catalytic domain family protein n=1 Tax=Aquiflexum lacus TaxID=2483805 RepID=UPI0018935568|nr:murein L,D-transpeptidase catalytic domain family protein [Aquiflexum lacus]
MRKFTLLITLLLGSTFSSYFLVSSSPASVLIESSVEDHFIELINSNCFNEKFKVPKRDILSLGIKGYLKLKAEGNMPEGKPLTVIDFSLPSSEKRMWIINMKDGVILHFGHVSHGRNSGDLMAQKFSNKNSSFMSSLGFYLTAETYQGKHGYSLRLDGLEPGFNDNARERAIVIHGADYAREDFIKQTGRLGRSLGCPALPQEITTEIIDLIKDRSVIFIYGKDDNYLNQSQILNA